MLNRNISLVTISSLSENLFVKLPVGLLFYPLGPDLPDT
jgi:hypothetical protein